MAILYFLFSGRKKSPKKNTPPVPAREESPTIPPVSQPKKILHSPKQTPVTTESNPQPSPKPFSLEEILKEFGQELEDTSEEKSKEVKAEVLEQPVKKVIDYDEDIKEEVESMETATANVDTKEAFLKDEHFDPYLVDQSKQNKFAEMLKDPEGAKTAFIAGEIFTRKYF